MPVPVHSHVHGAALAAAALGAALLAGCSERRSATYPVQGQVVFQDGTPVTSGTVEFESIEHRVNARGAIQRDGTFRLSTFTDGDGALAGRHRAVVVQLLIAEGERAIHHDHAPGQRAARAVNPRHARYETSKLAFDVSETRPNVITITVDAADDQP